VTAICHHECEPARSSTLYEPCCRGRQCYTSVAFRHRVVESVGRRLSAAFHFLWAVPTRRRECVMSAALLHCFDHARILCLGGVFSSQRDKRASRPPIDDTPTSSLSIADAVTLTISRSTGYLSRCSFRHGGKTCKICFPGNIWYIGEHGSRDRTRDRTEARRWRSALHTSATAPALQGTRSYFVVKVRSQRKVEGLGAPSS
jgi:hypothetical protein